MSKAVLEEPVIFKEIVKTPKKMIRVWRNFYRDRELLSFQTFWKGKESDDWQFGKAVVFDYEDINDIIDGLQDMEKWCEDNA